MESIAGVYLIRNKVNAMFYIGSSYRMKERWRKHRGQLRHQRHNNKTLQTDWNKYGEDEFEFIIVESCEPVDCRKCEQKWLDIHHGTSECYNLAPDVNKVGLPYRTTEHRNSLSVAAYNRTPEQEIKRAYARRRKYIIIDPAGYEFESIGLVDVCREHGLSVANMVNVACGKLKQTKGWKCRKIEA